MRVALYTRVSTHDQDATMQLTELREYAQFRKWTVAAEFSDTISGTKDKRPQLDKLLRQVNSGAFEVVLVWKFDRFARSTRFLLETLEQFKALGVDFVSLKDNVDTSTPVGKMLFTILGSVAELERNTLLERCDAGRKAAKRKGVRFGRPPVVLEPADIARVRRLRESGHSWREISAQMGIPKDTLIRRLEV